MRHQKRKGKEMRAKQLPAVVTSGCVAKPYAVAASRIKSRVTDCVNESVCRPKRDSDSGRSAATIGAAAAAKQRSVV